MAVKVKKLKEKKEKKNKSLGIQSYTIPVVFHIIHDGETVGGSPNIGSQYINAQLDQLNEDFANLSGSSYSQAADMEIQFCLAQIDTSGNCLTETGINRINRNTYNFTSPPYLKSDFENTIKPATQWDPDQYYNIWTAELANNLFGYSQMPEAPSLPGIPPSNITARTDGSVIHYNKVGGLNDPFPGSAPFNIGRTLTHETGHWLGLRHIWGDGGCGLDDYCGDTPIAAASSSGCPSGLDSCPSSPDPDMVENYMDYSNDICMNTFTADQRDRMHVVIQNSPRRSTLIDSHVCGCTPEADFIPQDLSIDVCNPNNTIQFEDKSLRVYNFTTYNWSFAGAGVNPTSSTTANPIVSVNSSGTLSASLTVTNQNGSHTKGPINYSINSAPTTPPPIMLNSPLDQSQFVSINPVLRWSHSSSSSFYYCEVATDPFFNNIIHNINTIEDTLQLSGLSPSTDYYWRIFSVNACNNNSPGTGNASPVWTFNTNSTICQTYQSSDTPITISSSSISTVNSTILIPAGSNTITDINIINLDISHSYISDLIVTLEGPDGQIIYLIDQLCGSDDNLLLNFSDQSSPHSNIPCPPTDGNQYQAFNLLSTYHDIDPTGNWILTITDTYSSDGGSLNSWTIEICSESPIPCPGDLSLNLSSTDVSCHGGNDGIAFSNATGSATPFNYQWEDGNSNIIGTQSILNNISAGWYYVTITDANACSTNGSILVQEPTPLNLNVLNLSNVSCNGQGDGQINIIGSGGSIPYTYAWSNGQNTSINNNLVPGNYTVTISDNQNCSYSENFSITEPSTLSSSVIQSIDVSCFSGSDGVIEIVGTGAVAPYSYTWSNGSTSSLLTGLSAGSYGYTITDSNSCVYSDQVIISEPADITVNTNTTNASCNTSPDGIANISITGGIGGYTLSITDSLNNNVGTSPTVNNLLPGWYFISILDANSCNAQDSFEIMSMLQWSIIPTGTDVTCAGANNGSLTAALTGGTNNYSYTWKDAFGTVVNTTGLPSGNYYITATDINTSCSLIDSVIISIGTGLFFSAGPSAVHTTCDGSNDGQLLATANGGVGPYNYVWKDINNNIVTDTGNAPGTYTIEVTDASGCTLNGSTTLGYSNTEYTMANNNMLTGFQSISQDYETDGRIESNQTITGSNILVDYDSGSSIQLKAGFKVNAGASFRAFIDGCGGAQ